MATPSDNSMGSKEEELCSSPLPFNNANNADGSDMDILRDLAIVDKLNNSKFTIFLAESNSTKQTYALKLFPFKNDKISDYYRTEIKFKQLKHQNVIQVYDTNREMDMILNGKKFVASYVLMEYAPHKDFFNLLMKRKIKLDEKLVRTFFHQLIAGIEYMHGVGAYHLDLKLDNLLLGKEY
mmetsp:Transcript_26755/g.23695  ORF Transcript_26755/g.23695 Transcript_26755/m.23695 type:complete len:181 (-) Transcript_26755:724-1266(-)|eukprot:CAMPEP_0114587176 /NCGR_PEP_ID=MMETSP0125-20121206/10201_1 /TAXON_ID=485358 ORGANISM="Aristerostoma sp., Strain ATCC 50986" /NCGR_SAMPLE_ID=MMETSP0125 /ASSEMBLY_ACC=CAM_ASM_000245 /LENGTH=180 /DNA_ID=CAMNT_0001782955 /DNA_START=55 /DNA_END=597 /DNA_ORIENTATION=+